jgi:hemerythrin superfamily protein
MTNCKDIFDRLRADHDDHRAMLDRIEQTHGSSDEREELFRRMTKDIKGHAAAEEQALYSTMLRKPPTTDETRHSVAEHHELEEMMNDIAATDMSSSAWLQKFRDFAHRYRHHIDEEEDDHFPDFEKYLTEEDAQHMRSVFNRRKQEERASAEVTPEKLEDAKE